METDPQKILEQVTEKRVDDLLSKLDVLASKVKPLYKQFDFSSLQQQQTSSQKSQNGGDGSASNNLAIHANPSNPPTYLRVLFAAMTVAGVKVRSTIHAHSSLSAAEAERLLGQEEFIVSNESERSKADLNVCFIWRRNRTGLNSTSLKIGENKF